MNVEKEDSDKKEESGKNEIDAYDQSNKQPILPNSLLFKSSKDTKTKETVSLQQGPKP